MVKNGVNGSACDAYLFVKLSKYHPILEIPWDTFQQMSFGNNLLESRGNIFRKSHQYLESSLNKWKTITYGRDASFRLS